MTRPTLTGIRPHVRDYAELTSLEVEVAKERSSLLILPVGATEQHGDGLPLGTDSIRADHVARAVVDRLHQTDRLHEADLLHEADGHDAGDASGSAFVLPSIDYGVSPHHRFLPGTVNIGPRLFVDLVTSVASQLADAGFDKILVITGHGGNMAALGVAQQTLLGTHPDLVFAYSPVSALATSSTAALPRTEISGHCGESETSQMLAIDERLVDTAHLNPGATTLADLDPRSRLSRTKSPSTAVTFDRYAENGVLGDPRTATATAGEGILGEVIDTLVAYCREMQRL
ncbi:creatininase family protein [Brevibacterium oceani]|uniref:creatininase family protein n=1 Tax=Brevibacterium oceani TaxID=358099 RepID=UPI0015E6BE45|nr:creatininase family protein [Brevibacterium oceani]